MNSLRCGAALFTVALPIAAAAQTYPVKPVRVIVPFPAGGPVETLARVFTQRLTETMGQPFVIDNRPGANSMVATEMTVKAPPDFSISATPGSQTVTATGSTSYSASRRLYGDAILYDGYRFCACERLG